jgi:hypothetical protein
MEQMRNTMQSMTQLMEQHQMMNQVQLSEVAGVMQRMSTNLQQVSSGMQSGINDQTMAKLQDQTKDMDRTLDKIKDQLHK